MEISVVIKSLIPILINDVVIFLFEWQQLIGSLIGAALPLSVFIYTRIYISHKEHLEKLEKVLVIAINNLIETDNTIVQFADGNLTKQIDAVSNAASNDYFIGKTFFPLLYTYEFPNELINGSSKSGYIDNLILKVYSRSKDMTSMISDSQRQFAETQELQLELVKMKQTTKETIDTDLNKIHETNLINYRNFLEDQWGEINLPIYLKDLITARTAISEFRKYGIILGVYRWRRKFVPISFRYFKNRTEIVDFKNSGAHRVEEFLRNQTQMNLDEIKLKFKRYQIEEGGDNQSNLTASPDEDSFERRRGLYPYVPPILYPKNTD